MQMDASSDSFDLSNLKHITQIASSLDGKRHSHSENQILNDSDLLIAYRQVWLESSSQVALFFSNRREEEITDISLTLAPPPVVEITMASDSIHTISGKQVKIKALAARATSIFMIKVYFRSLPGPLTCSSKPRSHFSIFLSPSPANLRMIWPSSISDSPSLSQPWISFALIKFVTPPSSPPPPPPLPCSPPQNWRNMGSYGARIPRKPNSPCPPRASRPRTIFRNVWAT